MTHKLPKDLVRKCKKLGVRLTRKQNGKRVYKSKALLKQQCARKSKRKSRRKSKRKSRRKSKRKSRRKSKRKSRRAHKFFVW